jgi:hypothetical protein
VEDTVQYGRSLQRNEKGRGRGRPSPKNGKGRGRGVTVNRHDPPCSFVLPPGEKGKLWPSTARSRTARPTTLECAPHSSRTVRGCACVASSRRYGAWQESTARRARPASASIFVGGDPSQRFNGCERRADARCAHSHGARAPGETVLLELPQEACAPIGRCSFPVHRVPS